MLTFFFQIWESSNKQTTDLPSIFERPSPLFESYNFVAGQILNPFIEFFCNKYLRLWLLSSSLLMTWLCYHFKKVNSYTWRDPVAVDK